MSQLIWICPPKRPDVGRDLRALGAPGVGRPVCGSAPRRPRDRCVRPDSQGRALHGGPLALPVRGSPTGRGARPGLCSGRALDAGFREPGRDPRGPGAGPGLLERRRRARRGSPAGCGGGRARDWLEPRPQPPARRSAHRGRRPPAARVPAPAPSSSARSWGGGAQRGAGPQAGRAPWPPGPYVQRPKAKPTPRAISTDVTMTNASNSGSTIIGNFPPWGGDEHWPKLRGSPRPGSTPGQRCRNHANAADRVWR